MARKDRGNRGFENITTAGNLGPLDLNRFQYEVANEISLDTKRPSRQKVNQLESSVHDEGGFSEGAGAGTQAGPGSSAGQAGTAARTATGAGGASGETKSAGSTSGTGKKTPPKS